MSNTNSFTPPSRKFNAEFVVGLFLILGVLAFAYLSMNLARMDFGTSNKKKVIAEFDNISGLNKGASVEIGGVKIGEVGAIALNGVTAEVTLNIDPSIEISDDDIASIRTKGIIGDRYVKIIPGASDTLVSAGGKISETESVVDLEEILGKFIHKME